MRLLRYKVTNFRSVQDSGWIEAEAVTALIGVNESGKTNLLLPLWKLNPAHEGELQPTSDYPKKMFGEIREDPSSFCFILAEFNLGIHARSLAEQTGLSEDEINVVQIGKFFDGKYSVSFPNFCHRTVLNKETVFQKLEALKQEIRSDQRLKTDTRIVQNLISKIEEIEQRASDEINLQDLKSIYQQLEIILPENPARTCTVVPIALQAIDELKELYNETNVTPPAEQNRVVDYILDALPNFVYYSNYGNLDSEIYLPQVVDNLKRQDLGAKEAAKARTLRVLFKFVRLEPDEILELGRDFKENGREPEGDEIAQIAEKKRERSILLQSAETALTQKFKDWWKQGNYRFELQADGNHFRIWVSDDLRTEKIELESRSTGLQWFLSFYLVFLVESLENHKNSILLLDEPGLSLHPLAQRDLSGFFDGLSKTNQIVYTSHSPFLVDADRIDRARKVYVDDDGTTKATADLSRGRGNRNQSGAAYAVHSALGLSVAESLLIGCKPIIVEGASDQHYLTAIKSLLISEQKISPSRELVFPPSGGAKTAKAIASILIGRNEELPFVLLDGDDPGKRMSKDLKSGLYVDQNDKILSTDTYVGFENSEIEDIFPVDFIAQVLDRWQRRAEEMFVEVVEQDKPIVGQIEEWAGREELNLPKYWKAELSKRVKEQALRVGLSEFDQSYVEKWTKLFLKFS